MCTCDIADLPDVQEHTVHLDEQRHGRVPVGETGIGALDQGLDAAVEERNSLGQ